MEGAKVSIHMQIQVHSWIYANKKRQNPQRLRANSNLSGCSCLPTLTAAPLLQIQNVNLTFAFSTRGHLITVPSGKFAMWSWFMGIQKTIQHPEKYAAISIFLYKGNFLHVSFHKCLMLLEVNFSHFTVAFYQTSNIFLGFMLYTERWQ